MAEVLILSPNREARVYLTTILREEGFTASAFGTAEEGLALLESAHDEFGLAVVDLERSKRFYRDILDLEIVAEDGAAARGRRYAFLGREGRIDVTLFEQAEARFDGRRAGLHHLSFQAPSIAAVASSASPFR